MEVVNFFNFDPDLAHQVEMFNLELPAPAFVDSEMAATTVESYRSLALLPQVREFEMRGRAALTASLSSRGYIIAAGLMSPSALVEEGLLRIATALGCIIGLPFQLAPRLGLWQTLGVDLEREPSRFGGVGYNPFHIDVVNSTHPPDLVCLSCIRNDPAGGGVTLLSNLQKMYRKLDEEDQKSLCRLWHKEGLFYGLHGAGSELNPFPVAELMGGNLVRIRFTAKNIHEIENSTERHLMERVDQLLKEGSENLILLPGQILFFNQLVIAHGRNQLGSGQSLIPSEMRRLLYQSYLHSIW